MDELTLNKSGLGVLKNIAHELGVPGSKSHTKYTKKNKDELIQQILKFQKMKVNNDQEKMGESQNMTKTGELQTSSRKRSVKENSDESDSVSGSDSSDDDEKVNETENKKLAKLEAKTKRKLQKPKTSKNETNNQIYMLLAAAGVIIVGASLHNQRKSDAKNEKSKAKDEEQVVLGPVVAERSHSGQSPEPSVEPSSPQPPQGPGIYSF